MNFWINKTIKKVFHKKNQKGLTLVELLIVVSIVVFLVLLAAWFYRSQVLKGKDTRRKADLKRIQVAVEEYEKDNNCYPTPDLVTCEPGTGLEPYLDDIPCDPDSEASYLYEHDSTGNCPSWYRLLANLEDPNDPEAQSACGPGGTFNYYISSPNAPTCNLIESHYFGCKGGVCLEILWDNNRPGPECDPNYTSSSCYGQCGPPQNECKPWNE